MAASSGWLAEVVSGSSAPWGFYFRFQIENRFFSLDFIGWAPNVKSLNV